MANYVLTQTGQEVQDILDSMGATYFFSQTATFASDNTYADYPYKGTISLVGVDGTMGVEVSFSNDQAISGNYSPICNTTNDAVEIWSKVNTSITIPTIKIYKNGYVNLNGSSNYMPQSGGNFTGAVTINNNTVLTPVPFSSLPNSKTVNGTYGVLVLDWQIIGKFCIMQVTATPNQAITQSMGDFYDASLPSVNGGVAIPLFSSVTSDRDTRFCQNYNSNTYRVRGAFTSGVTYKGTGIFMVQ